MAALIEAVIRWATDEFLVDVFRCLDVPINLAARQLRVDDFVLATKAAPPLLPGGITAEVAIAVFTQAKPTQGDETEELELTNVHGFVADEGVLKTFFVDTDDIHRAVEFVALFRRASHIVFDGCANGFWNFFIHVAGNFDAHGFGLHGLYRKSLA